MASVAICTAVWKPNVTSVPTMSLSIVFGTPTIGRPSSSCSWPATAASRCRRSTIEGVEAEVVDRPGDLLGPALGVERAAPPGAEHRPALRERATHRLDRQRHRLAGADTVPRVEEPDELVAVRALALANDRSNDRVQAWTVATPGEHPDTHRSERRGSSSAVPSIPHVAWDSTRPVPWKRLIKEWAIYAGIMAVILMVVFRDGGRLLPILGGLLVSGPIYFVFGAVLAKFGYQRKTLRRDAHAACARREDRRRTPPSRPPGRSRPPPGGRRRAPATDRAPSGDDLRRRHRRRHDGHPQPGGVHRRPPRRVLLPGVHPALPPTGLGRARPDRDLGGRAGDVDRRRRPGRPSTRWRRSASPTSARPSSRGTARPGSRSAGRSCGRTAGPPPAATSSPPAVTSTSCGRAPAWCSTRTSAAPRWNGCSGPGGVPVDRPTWPSAPSTPG